MNQSEQLDSFSAAVMAFEIRFERALTASWQDRETEAHSAIVAAPVREKYQFFGQFFKDVTNDIAFVVHQYFASLLHVAATNRERIAGQSPLDWTYAQVLTQIFDFLGLNEVFDPATDPRNDSRVLTTAERLTTGKGWWFDDGPSETFVLPRWIEVPHPVLMLRPPHRSEVTPQKEAEIESGNFSRTETLAWVKRKEFFIRKRIECQMDDEMWDGIIEAGKTGISVLDLGVVEGTPPGHSRPEPSAVEEPPENKFVREGLTWAIAFAGETCSLPIRVGLEYISILLRAPGREIRALELQNLACGLPRTSHRTAELMSKSIEDDRREEESPEEDYRPLSQSDFADDPVMDSTAIRQVSEKLKEVEREIAYRREIGDIQKADALASECAKMASYLKTSRNNRGRSRAFSGENEKARQSITTALKRAYKSIRVQAPKTADYLQSQIKTGSKFIYRDANTRWQTRRNSSPPSRPT